ncbi:MAG: hypothetical protein AAB864_02495 [Patescibacteria group bacterium]
MRQIESKKLATIILLCAIGVAFFEISYAHAIVAESITFVVNKVSWVIFELAANLLSLLLKGLNLAINMTASTDVSVVQSTWKIVRDFTNMFFILIMIAMAFSMIFKVSWLAEYDPGRIMAQFIIAALLINFSLVICGLIIDGTQSLNSIFITAIGDFGDRMGQFLRPGQWFELTNRDILNTPQLFFAGIMVFIVDFSLLVALVFAFIRVPFLWLLTILSPLALLASVLPSTKKGYQSWWHYFIGWNFFLPIFLAVLYLGMIVLSQQDTVISSIITTSAGSTALPLVAGLNITIQTLFFYALVAFMLIGGTNAAIKGSLIAGVGAVNGAQWAKNIVLRQTGIGAFQAAGKKRLEEIEKEGYGRIPGTQAKLFGGPAPFTKLAERAFLEKQTLIAKNIPVEKKKLEEEQRSIEELRTIMQTDKGYRGLAAGELLLKDKKLKVGEVIELRKRYADLKTPRNVAERGFLERAQAQLDDMAENNKFKDEKEFQQAVENLAPDGTDGFLRKAKKGNVNPLWVARIVADNNKRKLEKGDETDPEKIKELQRTAAQILEDNFKQLGIKEFVSFSKKTLSALTKKYTYDDGKTRVEIDPSPALMKWLTAERIAGVEKQASDEKREALEKVLLQATINTSQERARQLASAIAHEQGEREKLSNQGLEGRTLQDRTKGIERTIVTYFKEQREADLRQENARKRLDELHERERVAAAQEPTT